jgi:hypothetical protein
MSTDDAGERLLERAKRNDEQAISTMFRQFLPSDEQIVQVEYLGVLGAWGIGTRSFACVTDRRVATLRVRLLGEIDYQDASLEGINSGAVYQPSRLWLFVFVVVVSLFTAGLALLLLPLTVSAYYRFRKCGLLLGVRHGLSLYVFCDPKLLRRANRLYRTALVRREGRADLLAEMAGLHVPAG